MRRAAKVDANQAEIVRLLRQVPGTKVWVLNDIIDIAIAHRGYNFFVEIKNKDGKDELTDAQIKFIPEWSKFGQVRVAHTFEEILKLITESYQGEFWKEVAHVIARTYAKPEKTALKIIDEAGKEIERLTAEVADLKQSIELIESEADNDSGKL